MKKRYFFISVQKHILWVPLWDAWDLQLIFLWGKIRKKNNLDILSRALTEVLLMSTHNVCCFLCAWRGKKTTYQGQAVQNLTKLLANLTLKFLS